MARKTQFLTYWYQGNCFFVLFSSQQKSEDVLLTASTLTADSTTSIRISKSPVSLQGKVNKDDIVLSYGKIST